MSANVPAAHHGHDDHGHAAGHGHDDHAAHGSLRSYLIGFGLSVVLTAIPFWLVMSGVLDNAALTGFIILGFAAVQMVVHVIYFLHIDGRAEGGWSVMSMAFTLIVVVVMLSGSVWVMYHLNTNMMPSHDMRRML